MYELRYNTQQIVRVGVLLAKPAKFENPSIPVSGALLSWYYWKYLIKSDGTVISILNHTWTDILNCAGCYFLTLTATDTNKLGPLVLYIYDVALGMPIYYIFNVVNQNEYDAKYSIKLLKVEQQSIIN